MARRSRYQKRKTFPARRGVNTHRPPRRSVPSHSSYRQSTVPFAAHSSLLDGRYFNPQRTPRPLDLWGSIAPIAVSVRNQPYRRLYEHFQVRHPRQVPLCIRRSNRRRAVFASGFGGSRTPRKVRRNPSSAISC